MAAVAFDTLKFARRLKEAGVPEAQAEAQAELMAEAFVYNMDALVTKDYLEETLDARFAAQDLRLEKRFGEIDAKFAKNESNIIALRGEFTGELRLQRWILAAIAASTVVIKMTNAKRVICCSKSTSVIVLSSLSSAK